MTAEQKIKLEILKEALEHNPELNWEKGEITEDNINDAYDEILVDNDAHWDFESEFRACGIETELDAPYSRHYECVIRAKKMSDETWVAWPYWYGGGKYSNPEEIEWMEDAFEVNCTEKETVVLVRTFSRVEGNG